MMDWMYAMVKLALNVDIHQQGSTLSLDNVCYKLSGNFPSMPGILGGECSIWITSGNKNKSVMTSPVLVISSR